jgi:nucleoside-diphosphate-sugar epimerase
VKVLVTGCAGFIASHLTESLLRDGVEVVGVDCFNDNYGRSLKLQNLERARDWDSFEFIPLDMSRAELEHVVADVDVAFHLAGEPGVHGSWGERFDTYVRNNVVATQNLLNALRVNPHASLVYASSSSVYGRVVTFPMREDTPLQPCSPYGVTKLAAEHLCRIHGESVGQRVAILRCFSVYGPRQRPDMAFTRFCRSALIAEPITIFGDGLHSRDFTYVADVVGAMRRVETLEVQGVTVHNVAAGRAATLHDVVKVLSRLLGTRIAVQHEPPRPGDMPRTSADTTLARQELGYHPTTGLEAGLARQLEWVRESLPLLAGAG